MNYTCDNPDCDNFTEVITPSILGNPWGADNTELCCPLCREPVLETCPDVSLAELKAKWSAYNREHYGDTEDLISEYSYGDYESDY